MLTGLAHHLREFGTAGGDVLPKNRGHAHRCRVAIEIAVEGNYHPPLCQSREYGRSEVRADFVLSQSSCLALGIEALYTQCAQVVVSIVRRYIADVRDTIVVRGAQDCMECESVELVFLQRITK